MTQGQMRAGCCDIRCSIRVTVCGHTVSQFVVRVHTQGVVALTTHSFDATPQPALAGARLGPGRLTPLVWIGWCGLAVKEACRAVRAREAHNTSVRPAPTPLTPLRSFTPRPKWRSSGAPCEA
eukprot:183134-Chlamydomonas_euryale.AAC.2